MHLNRLTLNFVGSGQTERCDGGMEHVRTFSPGCSAKQCRTAWAPQLSGCMKQVVDTHSWSPSTSSTPDGTRTAVQKCGEQSGEHLLLRQGTRTLDSKTGWTSLQAPLLYPVMQVMGDQRFLNAQMLDPCRTGTQLAPHRLCSAKLFLCHKAYLQRDDVAQSGSLESIRKPRGAGDRNQ